MDNPGEKENNKDRLETAPDNAQPGSQYTGEGFMPYKDLTDLVSSYQTRKALCEDVDQLEKLGGTQVILEKLKTTIENGIKSTSLEDRIKAFGTNEPPKGEDKSCLGFFLDALNDHTLIILMIAAVISIIVNMITEEEHRNIAWVEGFAIFCAVFISSGVQSVNDYHQMKQFKDLNEESLNSTTIKVTRDGQQVDLRLAEVVVGDIVNVVAGDEIAGDAILLKGSSVLADEASMTGESDALAKEALDACLAKRNKIIERGNSNTAGHHEVPSPILLSGTNFKNGKGKMVIIAVGDRSAIGKIRKTVKDNTNEETPLQKKLTKIADQIGYFGLVSAIITFVIICILAGVEWKQKGQFDYRVLRMVVDGFLIGITILVVAIPEGLPLAVTLSLAFSIKKMQDDKNLVRKLHACETMGGADIICSDKTGTLTQNKMYLTHFWNCDASEIYDNKSTKVVNFAEFIGEPQMNIFQQLICCNSSADPDKEEGNPTELAMVNYMKACGVNTWDVRKKYDVIADEPFSSDRKRMSTLIKDDDDKELMLIKGASELILKSCDKLLDLSSGEIRTLDEAAKEDINYAIIQFAEMSLRTIGLAFSYPEEYDKTDKDKDGVLSVEKTGLTLVGICGIKDVLRPEVPPAVEKCRKAGITVKMVTGDNKVTARAIAIDCKIIEDVEGGENSEFQVMLGKDFYDFVGGYEVLEDPKTGRKVYTVKNKSNFNKCYKHIKVLARSRPEDKLTMVVGLRERGHVVAVTGDGTNDAPALSKANVGFAMGITGTEIAKQAADILLTDDNFSSIVSAVKWGRNIYDNVRKFLQFQLTVNVVAVMITFISSAITKQNILSAVQMLWVNLIMDTLASLALATEPPTEELLERKPIPPTTGIVSKKMTKHILGQSMFQLTVLCIFFFMGPKFLIEELNDKQKADPRLRDDGYDKYELGPSRHETYCFNVFVMMTVFNFINARKLYDEFNVFAGIFKSTYFILIVLGIFILQAIIVTFGDILLNCAKGGLGPIGWGVCIGVGIIGNIWRIFIRFIPENLCCPSFGAEEIKDEDREGLSSLNLKKGSRKSSNILKGSHKN